MPDLSLEETAFPKLTPAQLDLVGQLGELRSFADGEDLITVGQKEYPFCVIRSGEVKIIETSTGEPREVVTHPAGAFVGDIDLLTGRPAVISAVAHGPTEAYVMSAVELRRLLNEIPEISEILLDAFQMRRRLLESSGFLGTKVIGDPRSKETLMLREFFYRNHVPHTFYDVREPEGAEQLAAAACTTEDLPVLSCSVGVVKNPPLADVAECLGISREIDDTLYDLIVVGAGPAGLASAVYASSEGLRTLVIDRIGPGGQAGSSSKIENFIGFPSGLSGAELANLGYLQALKFGTQFTAPVSVKKLDCSVDGEHRLHLCTGQVARARCVLAATGVSYRQLNLEGARRFEGAGIYYAATSVEARVCKASTAVVVGGGNSAGQAAMYLAQHAERVLLLIRGDDLRKSMSDYLSQRVLSHEKIEVCKRTEVVEVLGDHGIGAVRVRNNETQKEEQWDCAALFIFIGARPYTDWLPESVRRDERGFLITGATAQADELWPLDRAPCELETTCPGIMAAGDVRSGTTKRCGFAVGDGSLAVSCVHRYLDDLS